MASNYERIKRAVSMLDGPGSIQERLASAYRTEVQYVGPEGLDEGSLYELEAINDELTKVEAAGDKDTIDMSVQDLVDGDAQALARRVRALYEYLARQRGQ